MVGDTSKDIGQPGLRIDIVEPRGLDERVEDGRSLAAAIGSAEQPSLSAKRNAAQSPFCGVVGDADPTIVEEPGERIPAAQHVVYGLGEIMIAGQLGELVGQPDVKLGDEWRAQFLANSEPLGRTLAAQVAFDVEQRIEPLHGLQRDRIDHACTLIAALPACHGRDIGQFEELRLAWAKQPASSTGPGWRPAA